MWWLTAIVLLFVALFTTGRQVINSLRDRWLIVNGTAVKATIVRVNNVERGSYSPDADAVFTLHFELPAGVKHEIVSRLKDQRETLVYKQVIPLFVDPAAPTGRWTDRRSISWTENLLVAYIIAPVIVIVIFVALIRRTALLKTWQIGLAAPAIVVETKQASTAPLSRVVSFTLLQVTDTRVVGNHSDSPSPRPYFELPPSLSTRVFSIYLPTRFGQLQPGDQFWVIMPPGKPEGSIVAGLYS